MKRHMNKVYRGFAIFGGIAVLLGVCRGLGNTAQALTYQNEANVEFGINPTIGVSLSASGLVIDNLAPGTSANSNIITVSVNTNASHGYYLSATTGTAGGNTDLTMTNPANSNYKFANLTGNKATLDSFEDNKWGYSYCLTTNDCTNTTNWVSGNYGSTSAGYNGLPLDNNDNGATGVALINTTSPVANNSVQFKIGAKASNAQAAGTYTGTVNFYAVTNPEPEPEPEPEAVCAGYTKMQDTTAITALLLNIGDTATVCDARDNTKYKIGKLADGNVWLLDNLALDLTDADVKTAMYNNTDTMTHATYAQLGYLFNGGGSGQNARNGVQASWSDSFTSPYIAVGYKDNVPSDSTSQSGGYKVGVYYNYCAASSGSYCYEESSTPYTTQNITADICPKGWRMPTGSSSGEFQTLYSNSSYNTFDKYRNALHLPLAGDFAGGSPANYGSEGDFWSATTTYKRMYGLYLSTKVGDTINTGWFLTRSHGAAVRCVLGS